MSAADLTALVEAMDDPTVEQLLALFADVKLTISLPPRTGLVMLTVTDSFATDFHLGEILVTEARVLFQGCEGFGMVSGEAPRRALARAASDAVLNSPEPCFIREELETFLVQEGSRRKTQMAEHAALVAATRVQFDLMPGA